MDIYLIFYILIIVITIILILLLFRYYRNKTLGFDSRKLKYSNDIIEIPNFLSNEESDSILSLSLGRNFEESTVDIDGSSKLDTTFRQSQTVWLDDSNPIVLRISDRISNYLNIPRSHQEQLQIVRYQPGGRFNAHYDACDNGPDKCVQMNGSGDSGPGPRLVTFLIYLNDNFMGGTTTFPYLNKTIKPQKGKAVIFYNVNPQNNEIIKESLHQGDPLLEGQKWIANKWIHIRPWS